MSLPAGQWGRDRLGSTHSHCYASCSVHSAIRTPLRHHLGGEPDQHHLSVKARDAADGLSSAAVCCNGLVLLGKIFTGNQDDFPIYLMALRENLGKHRFSHFKWGFPVPKFSHRSIDCNHQQLNQPWDQVIRIWGCRTAWGDKQETYLVGGIPIPLWKLWVRQLGWWHSQLNGKIKFMFQTTNQIIHKWWFRRHKWWLVGMLAIFYND